MDFNSSSQRILAGSGNCFRIIFPLRQSGQNSSFFFVYKHNKYRRVVQIYQMLKHYIEFCARIGPQNFSYQQLKKFSFLSFQGCWIKFCHSAILPYFDGHSCKLYFQSQDRSQKLFLSNMRLTEQCDDTNKPEKSGQ